jgi:hypothetical protein
MIFTARELSVACGRIILKAADAPLDDPPILLMPRFPEPGFLVTTAAAAGPRGEPGEVKARPGRNEHSR